MGGGDVNPQQAELRRSGFGATDAGSAKRQPKGKADTAGNTGPVPEENQPGHHPDVEQDKPEL